MLSVQEGGVQAYKKWKGLEESLVAKGEISAQEISRIQKDDILKLLEQKGISSKK
jgi:hypothetical protein